MAQFLYPCPECHQKIELVTAQAGQDLECPNCQHLLEVPKLGVLRNHPATTQSSAVKTNDFWLQRTLFTVGLASAVLFGVAGGALYGYASNLMFETDIDGAIEHFSNEVDAMSAPELLTLWNQMGFENGLGEWQELSYARYNKQGAILKQIAYGLFGLAGVGFLGLIASLVMKRR